MFEWKNSFSGRTVPVEETLEAAERIVMFPFRIYECTGFPGPLTRPPGEMEESLSADVTPLYLSPPPLSARLVWAGGV